MRACVHGMCAYMHACLYMGTHLRGCQRECIPEAGVGSLPYVTAESLS